MAQEVQGLMDEDAAHLLSKELDEIGVVPGVIGGTEARVRTEAEGTTEDPADLVEEVTGTEQGVAVVVVVIMDPVEEGTVVTAVEVIVDTATRTMSTPPTIRPTQGPMEVQDHDEWIIVHAGVHLTSGDQHARCPVHDHDRGLLPGADDHPILAPSHDQGHPGGRTPVRFLARAQGIAGLGRLILDARGRIRVGLGRFQGTTNDQLVPGERGV